MKTFIAVAFFGILTYAFADADDIPVQPLVYGKGVCQNVNVEGLVNLNAKMFFSGTWYLTHATPSTRVTLSTICRDFASKLNADGTLEVTYGYYENGGTDNHNQVSCSGAQNKTRPDIFNFDCNSKIGCEENTNFHIDASFLVVDYDSYGVVYRCVTIGTHTEDNIFLIFREKNPSEDTVKQIKNYYGLNDLISRKDATCKN